MKHNHQLLINDAVGYTTEEWEKIIENKTPNTLSELNHTKVRESLIHGIHPTLRPAIWNILLQIDKVRKQYAVGKLS